jgi:DNA transformation protein
MPKPLDDFSARIVQQLQLLGRVSGKNMFGGVGIYRDGVFFALTADERLYFRVNDETRPAYESAGMSCFQPWPDEKPGFMMRTYYEVPPHVQRHREELCGWASEAAEIARLSKTATKKAKPKKSAKKKSKLRPNKKVTKKTVKQASKKRT